MSLQFYFSDCDLLQTNQGLCVNTFRTPIVELKNAEAKLGTRNTERTAKHGDRSRRQVVLCSLLT